MPRDQTLNSIKVYENAALVREKAAMRFKPRKMGPGQGRKMAHSRLVAGLLGQR